MSIPNLSIRVDLQHAKEQVWLRLEGALSPAHAEGLGQRIGDSGHVSAVTRDYFRKNFFSITFLALYRSVGVPPERRLFYGVVNHAIRGVVTASDNILDDEYKLPLPLALPGGGA